MMNMKLLEFVTPPYIYHLQNRIADLKDKIGVGYFDFDSHVPHSPGQNKKPTLQKLQPPLEQEEEGPT